VTEVGLVVPQGAAVLDVAEVRVTIVLRPREGTRSIEIGIELENAEAGLRYEPTVETVRIVVGGTMAALDALDASRLTARLDVAGLREGTTPVDVAVTLPDYVTLRSTSPSEVVVTITPASTPAPAATATPVPTPTPEP
jgi:YbbR domain-containing protein